MFRVLVACDHPIKSSVDEGATAGFPRTPVCRWLGFPALDHRADKFLVQIILRHKIPHSIYRDAVEMQRVAALYATEGDGSESTHELFAPIRGEQLQKAREVDLEQLYLFLGEKVRNFETKRVIGWGIKIVVTSPGGNPGVSKIVGHGYWRANAAPANCTNLCLQSSASRLCS